MQTHTKSSSEEQYINYWLGKFCLSNSLTKRYEAIGQGTISKKNEKFIYGGSYPLHAPRKISKILKQDKKFFLNFILPHFWTWEPRMISKSLQYWCHCSTRGFWSATKDSIIIFYYMMSWVEPEKGVDEIGSRFFFDVPITVVIFCLPEWRDCIQVYDWPLRI